MTDTLTTEPPAPQPAPQRSRRLNATAVIAIVAVAALAIVAVLAVRSTRNDSLTTMMGRSSATSMPMNGNGMMGGNWMMGSGQTSPAIIGARDIAVTATSFAFNPTEIHVKTGEQVNITVHAADVAHDLTIDALGFRAAAPAGSTVTGGLTAPSAPGRYTFYCSVSGHRQAGMTGTLVVDPQ